MRLKTALRLHNRCCKLTQTTVADLLTSREREGARLALMLQSHLAQLRILASQAGPLIPLLVAQQRAKFMDRWNEALAGRWAKYRKQARIDTNSDGQGFERSNRICHPH